jgi:tRNA dimethylallyltransferase
MKYDRPKLIVIVGPTSSGKSDLAVEIAKSFNGEIISADSRQIYRGLDIGTGKITKREMGGIPHHLLDVIRPSVVFSAADFQRHATKAMKCISERGKIPILAGGTGLYVRVLIDNIRLPCVRPDKLLRRKLGSRSLTELFGMLKRMDPDRAASIDPKNKRRIIRAIEIATDIGSSPELSVNQPSLGYAGEYDVLQIGLRLPADKLKKRILDRLLERLRKGMITEAKRLHKKGLSWKRMEELGLEYRFMARHLQGRITKEEMLTRLESESHKYAKRQMTWFKKDKRIKWFPPAEVKLIKKEVEKFLTS